MGSENESRAEYIAGLPKKRMAAGTVWWNTSGEVLIGKLSYRPNRWSISGGVVEEDESPWEAARRETKAEIGLEPKGRRLLCVHYIAAKGDDTETIQFYFLGGVLTSAEIARITLPDGSEWQDFRFAGRREADELLTEDLAGRFNDWAKARETGETIYVET